MRFTAVFVALFLTLAVSAAPNPQNRGGNGGNKGGITQGGQGGKGGNQGGAGQGKGSQNNVGKGSGKGGAVGGAGGANNGTNIGTGTGAGTGTSTGTGATNGTDTGVGSGTVATNGTDTGVVDVGDAGNGTASASCGSGSGDPQTSLCLDPRVIAPGFANNGQDVPTAGQVPSATSTNNFINACLLTPNLPLTNGQQIKTGSCNPAPMGVIPSTDNMPSSKFTFPTNGVTIASNTNFTISMAISNLETGNFVNAEENYFAAPQALNNAGQIQGHSHVVVELLTALDQTTPTNPNVFAFFKGLNGVAQGGILTAAVTNGLPAGVYKLSSINTAANHQPVLVPIAQHGSLDDVVYFTISDDPNAASDSGSNATDTGAAATGTATGNAADNTAVVDDTATTAAGNAADTATTTSAAAAAATTSAGAATGSNGGKGQKGSQGGQGGQGNKGGQGGQGGNKGKGGRK